MNKFLKNKRIYLAIMVMVSAFLVSKNFFMDSSQTSSDCQNESCPGKLDKPNLSDKTPTFYINNIFDSNGEEYFRLVFLAQSDNNTNVSVSAATPPDEEKEIKSFAMKKMEKAAFQEIIFKTDKKFTDIKFEKSNKNDGADVLISDVHISKIQAKNDLEIAQLKPTVFGETDLDLMDQGQTQESSEKFEQLKEKDMILGQIFKPQVDILTGVTFDADLASDNSTNSKKYRLELREAEFNADSVEISTNIVAETLFSPNDINKYRQKDGRIKFPIFSLLDKNKYYFIGIDNGRVQINRFNNITLRGTRDATKYPDGIIAIMKGKITHTVSGSLYFATYGIRYKEMGGMKILNNAVIEDLGGGYGRYWYASDGNPQELVDLRFHSDDVEIGDDKFIFGYAKPNSNFIYQFNTVYPIKKIYLEGKQPGNSWSKTRLSYSFDGNDWQEVPFLADKADPSLQIYDAEIPINLINNQFFIKFEPVEKNVEKKYGLKNFKVSADLDIKN